MAEWFISSAVLIALVLALQRVLGKKISAVARYALWLVVLARLLIPVQLVSLPVYSTEGELPAAVVSPSVPVATLPEAPEESGTEAAPTAPASPAPGAQPTVSEPVAASWTLEKRLTAVWLCGAGVLGTVIVTSNLRFSLALRRRRTRLKGADCALPVYTVEGLESPCLVGLVRPAVYLAPEDTENAQRLRHVLAHEQAHWHGGDHMWAVGRAAALCLHWFDPLVWVAAALSKRDAELACDARTLKVLGDGERAAYGETLLYRQIRTDAWEDSNFSLVGKYNGNIINRLVTLASAHRVECFGFLPNSELRSSQTATVLSGKTAWAVEDAERDDVLGSLREIGADAALYREVTGEDTLVLYPSFDCGMTVELVGGGHISLWPLIESGDGAVLLRYVSDTENRTFLLPSAGGIRMNILRITGVGDTKQEQLNAIYDRVSVPYSDLDDFKVVARSLVRQIVAAWMEIPA